MAVSIPAGIYSLGNVRIDDSQRLANLEGQLLAKKAAKQQAEQDAINKYIADQAGKVTSTGVRTVDLPGFEKRRQQWMQFGMQNKEKILKDPMTRVAFDKMGQELMSYIQTSKGEEEKGKPIKSLIVDPTKRKELNTDRVMLDIDYHDLPLDDPRRRSIDYNASWYKAPTFDFIKEFESAAKGQQKSYLGEVKGSFNAKSGKYLTEQGFAPKAVGQIVSNFVRAVEENPEKLDYYERKAKNMDVGEIADLNTYFTRYFPGQKIDADHPLTIAAAEAIKQAESARDIVPETNVVYTSGLNKQASGDVGRIDLRNYPIVEGKRNVTDLFQGVKVTGLPKGDSWAAKRVLYDPSTNSVTLTEYVSRDSEGNLKGEQTRVVPFETFKQNIKSLNPGADFKYVSGLSSAITGGEGSSATPAPPANAPTMSRAEFGKLSITKRQEFLNKGGIVK